MKKAVIVLIVLAVIVGGVVFRTYYFAGECKVIKPHYSGVCTIVGGIPGSEDITIDRQSGLAFISSYDRRRYGAGQEAPGAIFAVDYKAKNPVPKNLTAGFKKEFHPHGISLYHDPSGKTSLFAISHTHEGNVVEIFEYANGALEHRNSVPISMLWRPNDLLAVGPERFYISNDHGNKSSIGRMLEDFIPLKRSFVLYYDGKKMTEAAESIAGANGIAMSADGKTLYIAATMGKKIHVYDRDAASGKLTSSFDIDLGSRPDNIELDETGALYVACIPKGLTHLAHIKNGNKPSPSQAFKITIKGKGDYTVDEVFLDDGKNINGATVAAPFQGGLILGQSKDLRNQILICTENTAAK